MLIVFESKTGNVQRFMNKIATLYPEHKIVNRKDNPEISEPFIVVTYTTGFGQVPTGTLEFLEQNRQYLVGVASSGNRNWKTTFARSGEIIANRFHVPLILQFELSGTSSDVSIFAEGIASLLTKAS